MSADSPRDLSPLCPHAIDLLRFLAGCRGDPEHVGHFDANHAIHWVCRRINELRGIRFFDLTKAVHRIAEAEPVLAALDGWPAQPWAGEYGQARDDLTHVAKALRQMDEDGGTQELCRELCVRWPILAEAWERTLAAQSVLATHVPRQRRSHAATAQSGMPMAAMLSAAELAHFLGQPKKRVSKFLDRLRAKRPDSFVEVDAPRKNAARYLYRTADVWPHLINQLPLWQSRSATTDD